MSHEVAGCAIDLLGQEVIPALKAYQYPDVEADRALHEALRVRDYQKWRHTPLASIEESGQQEMLNWMCLVEAMAELGRRADETEVIQTYRFNSSKCLAFFQPG